MQGVPALQDSGGYPGVELTILTGWIYYYRVAEEA